LPQRDFFVLGLLGISIFLAALFSVWIRRHTQRILLARKLLHVVAIGSCALAFLLLDDISILLWVSACVYPLLAWLVVRRRFQEEVSRPAWGILWFPPAMWFIWLLTGNPGICSIAMLILAVSDAAAAFFGSLWGRKEFSLTGDKKTILGSLSFFLSALSLLQLGNCLEVIHVGAGQLLATALIGTVLEASGSGGRDNFWVPLGVALCLSSEPSFTLSYGIWLLFIMSMVLMRFGWLTASGSLAAFLLASGISSCAGPEMLLPPFVFLFVGSVLGKLPGKTALEAKQGKPRDHVQVWSNGAVALLALWLGADEGKRLFLVSLAVSCADTCSSELGTRYGRKTLHPLRFKEVIAGTSGGMSLAGTLAAVPAAFLIACFSDSVQQMLLVGCAGFAGMWLDSILGCTIQAKFRNQEGIVSEEKMPGFKLVSGFERVNNDLVNVLSNAITTAATAIMIL